MSSQFTPAVRAHGGHRSGSGRPKGSGKRRRRRPLTQRKSPTPAVKRFKMRENKRNHRIDDLQVKTLKLEKENERLNNLINQKYNQLDQYLDHQY